MLSKIICRRFIYKDLFDKQRPIFTFSSDHHDHHDHHDYSVHIDKNATWIKFKTSRKLACIQGIIDTHYQLQDPDDSDPWVHLNTNPFYSIQNLAYNDPYYHEDQHEPLVSEQTGYSQGSDPIDQRWDISIPNIYTMMSLMLIISLVLIMRQGQSPSGRLHRKRLAYEYVQTSLQNKSEEINNLKEKILQLSNQ